jgi:diguanylate cyclase (GGDEF)-like protein
MRLRARRRVCGYGAIALLVIAAFASLSVRPLVLGRREVRQDHNDDLALRQVLDYRATLADWQVFIEPQLGKLRTTLADIAPADIAKGAQLTELQAAQAQRAVSILRTMGFGDIAREIANANAVFAKSLNNLGPLIAGRPLVEIAAGIAAERATFTQARAVTATAAAELKQAVDRHSQQSIRHLDNGRTTVMIVNAMAAVLVVFGTVLVGRGARRREYAERMDSQRQDFEVSLQQALDMARTESDAYGIMREALHESVPHLQVEMLVADSSRAHFQQMLTTSDATQPGMRTGCGVVSPLDCPAAIRGRTIVFPTSRALDACPYLKARPSGDLSATCVALNITGRTSGVVHATGLDGAPPAKGDVAYLEMTLHRASERIAMLRAFEKSEAQARTDPLTGLWNRRSLENRVRDLQRDGTPYALAYGDLDHFKVLNDTHGHEAGDQALRLFARVLRDSIRPTDITARYGGEEFLVVLPECDVETATKILERLRERLALTLGTGRVPPFTVSFGLAASSDADTFDEVVAVADQALLTAKTAGRNRTVVAGGSTARAQTPLVS